MYGIAVPPPRGGGRILAQGTPSIPAPNRARGAWSARPETLSLFANRFSTGFPQVRRGVELHPPACRRPGRPRPAREGPATTSDMSPSRADLEHLELVFSALAHAQRRQILLALHFQGGELAAGEIAERFPCSWPTTSRHLRQLVDAELVSFEPRGRERVYRLERGRLDVVREWVEWFETPAR